MSATITANFHRSRRGGRIIFGDEPTPPAKSKREPDRRPSRAAITLAFAHKLRQALDDGRIANLTDAAKRLAVTRSRVGQILNLTLLPVAEQERILFLETVCGREPRSERSVPGHREARKASRGLASAPPGGISTSKGGVLSP